MKKLSMMLLVSFAFVAVIFGQVKTKETKTTTDSTGRTVTTSSTIISTSEDITPRGQMIVINPLKFIIFYNMTYFHKVTDNMALGVGFQLPTISGIDGYGINAEMRLYPSGRTLKGFYFAPNISYNSLSSGENSTHPFSIGALVGWQWFPGDDFAIGLGIGVDYYSGSSNKNDSPVDFGDYHGSVPAVRFDIGYGW